MITFSVAHLSRLPKETLQNTRLPAQHVPLYSAWMLTNFRSQSGKLIMIHQPNFLESTIEVSFPYKKTLLIEGTSCLAGRNPSPSVRLTIPKNTWVVVVAVV